MDREMKQLIDKCAVVAGIENRIKELQNLYEENKEKLDSIQKTAIFLCIDECKGILSFLNTIETKEANPIWNDARKTIPEDSSNQIICIKEDDLAVATVGKLVRGTKKWAYLNDLLNISDVETKNVNLEKELKILDNTLFDLDGVAIAGATHYLTVEDVKDIAKRFFEMGLKAQEIIKRAKHDNN